MTDIEKIRVMQRELDAFAARITARRDEAGPDEKADLRFIGKRIERALRHIDAIVERFEG